MTTHSNSLHTHIADLIAEIKKRSPDAAVEISYQPYETEDAHLIVHPPDNWSLEQCEELAEYTAECTCNLLLKAGVSIPVLVLEPVDKVNAAKKAHLAGRKKKAS